MGWGTGTDLGPEDLSIFSRMRSSTHNVKMKTGAPDDCRHSPSPPDWEIASAFKALGRLQDCDKVWAVCEKAGEKLWGWGPERTRQVSHNPRSHRYQGNAEQGFPTTTQLVPSRSGSRAQLNSHASPGRQWWGKL